MQVALLGGFEGFEELLSDLPEGAALGKRFTAETRLGLYVVRSERELTDAYEHASGQLPQEASFWVIYPKQAKKAKTSFNENDVREARTGERIRRLQGVLGECGMVGAEVFAKKEVATSG